MLKKIIMIVVLAILSVPIIGYAEHTQEKLIIYYFHKTIRCPSCILLEELTRFAVTSGFDAELKNGRIELKVINIDEPGNSHFEKHYNLPFQSVVISAVVSGIEKKWKNLTLVWDYLDEDDKFRDYVQKEITFFLNDITGSTANESEN